MISLAKLVDLRDKWRNYEPTQQECDMLADALSAALKVVEAVQNKQPEVLAMIRNNGFVFDGKHGRWEKLAFKSKRGKNNDSVSRTRCRAMFTSSPEERSPFHRGKGERMKRFDLNPYILFGCLIGLFTGSYTHDWFAVITYGWVLTLLVWSEREK